MAGNRCVWRVFLVMLLVAAAALALPAAARNGESPPLSNEPLNWTLAPGSDEAREETGGVPLNWTLAPSYDEAREETPAAAPVETAGSVTPGDVIRVTDEPQIYDLSALRNETEPAPIIELHAYEDDDPGSGRRAGTVNLNAPDTGVELEVSDFRGIYGIYYPYDGETVVDKPVTVEGHSDADETANATEVPSSGAGAEGTSTTSDTITPDETLNEAMSETTTEIGSPAATETGEVTEEAASTVDLPTFTPMVIDADPVQQAEAAPLHLTDIIVSLLAAAGLFLVIQRS